jgi:uncharacterized membrane protein YdjX (TVP38/TMEM64 family)
MVTPASKNRLNFLILVLILIFCWLLGSYCKIDSENLKSIFSKFPLILSGAIFVLLYVVLTFFIWFSKDILRVLSALIFGTYLSTVLVYLSEMINLIILFTLSRFLGRGFVKNQLRGAFAGLDRRIGKFSFWSIFSLRIIPLVPFRFLDIAAGLTEIPFEKYFIASVLGTPLRIFWLQLILAAVGLSVFKDTNSVLEYFLNNRLILVFSLIYLAAAIILGVILQKRIFKEEE